MLKKQHSLPKTELFLKVLSCVYQPTHLNDIERWGRGSSSQYSLRVQALGHEEKLLPFASRRVFGPTGEEPAVKALVLKLQSLLILFQDDMLGDCKTPDSSFRFLGSLRQPQIERFLLLHETFFPELSLPSMLE